MVMSPTSVKLDTEAMTRRMIFPDLVFGMSGKIMRRVIAATSNFADIGDITTLANPEIVEQIREQVQSAKRAKGEEQRELSQAEEHEIKSFGSEG